MFARVTSRSCIRIFSNPISKSVSMQTTYRNLSSSSRFNAAKVLFDQTKKNNDPEEESTDVQMRNSKPAPPKKKSNNHPAKEAEAEEPTSRSTGIKSEGQEHQAGEGENKNVHTEHREKPGPNMTWGNS